jgi:serine/threonine protein kinase
VRALQLGAVDYLPKRLLTPERLSTTVRVALRRVERRVARRLASLAQLARDQAANANPAAADAPAASPAPAEGCAATPEGEGEALQPAGVAALLAAANAEVIPGYTLRLKIGESEKAVVYLASSAHRGHNVALKVSKTLRDEAAGRQFLEREYTAIMAVRSPLVVEIYDYGVHAGFEYLAMEYLPRGDLKARIQRGVSEAEALHYAVQITAALQVVHEAGLVHRDLKPPNVMLRENDGVALIDFGLARSVDGNTVSTHTGVLLGSPYYMSPEQALGEPLDARSDFYSLGIICYEMLTGQKPYTGGTAMEVLQQHVSSPLPALPDDLRRYQPFLARLLAKARGERFATAAEIMAAAAALRNGAAGEVQTSAA